MENTIDRKKAARSAFIRSSAFQRLIIIAVLILLYGFFYIASLMAWKVTIKPMASIRCQAISRASSET